MKPISEYVKNITLRADIDKTCKACNSDIYKEYIETNRDKELLRQRIHYLKNKPAIDAKHRVWCRNNPEKNAAKRAKRRAALLSATPAWANLNKIKEFYKIAGLYNEKYPENAPWHVDHVIPLRGKNVCGLHVEDNLQVIPKTKNMQKGNRFFANN